MTNYCKKIIYLARSRVYQTETVLKLFHSDSALSFKEREILQIEIRGEMVLS